MTQTLDHEYLKHNDYVKVVCLIQDSFEICCINCSINFRINGPIQSNLSEPKYNDSFEVKELMSCMFNNMNCQVYSISKK